jgi:hypothetical protein
MPGPIDVRAGSYQKVECGSVPWLVDVHVACGGVGEDDGPRQFRNRAERGADLDQGLVVGESMGHDATLDGARDLG